MFLAGRRSALPESIPALLAFEKVGLNEGGFVRRKTPPSVLLQVVIVRVQGTLRYPCVSDGELGLTCRFGEGFYYSSNVHTTGSLFSMREKAAVSEVRKG